MTTIEFCQSAGLTLRELQSWLETGLPEARPAPGIQCGPGRAGSVIKALHANGTTLSQLARANLTFDAGQAFVIFEGREFRAFQDAAAAIAAVVRVKRWCSAVDLTAIRAGVAE